MPDPSTLRDSTQIVLPSDALEGIREDLNEQFTLTLFEMDGVTVDGNGATDESGTVDGNGATDESGTADGDGTTGEGGATGEDGATDEGGATGETAGGHYVRIIGSPVEIKAATDFLSRHGVSLP